MSSRLGWQQEFLISKRLALSHPCFYPDILILRASSPLLLFIHHADGLRVCFSSQDSLPSDDFKVNVADYETRASLGSTPQEQTNTYGPLPLLRDGCLATKAEKASYFPETPAPQQQICQNFPGAFVPGVNNKKQQTLL